jgi:hypothetical protein
LKRLLTEVGFHDGDACDLTLSRLGNFQHYENCKVGGHDSDWNQHALPTNGDGKKVYRGLHFLSLLVCYLLTEGGAVGDADASHPVGNVDKCEQTIMAKSLVVNTATGTLSTVHLSTSSRHHKAMLQVFRKAAAYTVEPFVNAGSRHGGATDEMTILFKQVIDSESCRPCLLTGRLDQLSVFRNVCSGIRTIAVATQSDMGLPKVVREIHDDEGDLVGGEFEGDRVHFADFGVAQVLVASSVKTAMREVANAFSGGIKDALVALCDGRVSALGIDSSRDVTCSIDVANDGSWGFVRITQEACASARQWRPGSVKRTEFLSKVCNLRRVLCAALVVFGGGPSLRVSDVAASGLVTGTVTSSTQFPQFQLPTETNKLALIWLAQGAKPNSTVAKQVHRRRLAQYQSLGILLLRCVLAAQRVLLPAVHSSLLLQVDGTVYSDKSRVDVVFGTFREMTGETIPEALRGLNLKRLDSVLAVWYSERSTLERVNGAYSTLQLEALASSIGHTLRTHVEQYAQRTFGDGTVGAESEARRKYTMETSLDFLKWRCGGDVTGLLATHDLFTPSQPPSPPGMHSLYSYEYAHTMCYSHRLTHTLTYIEHILQLRQVLTHWSMSRCVYSHNRMHALQ